MSDDSDGWPSAPPSAKPQPPPSSRSDFRSPAYSDDGVDPNLRGLFRGDAARFVDLRDQRMRELDPILPNEVFAAPPAAKGLGEGKADDALLRHLRAAAPRPSSLAGDFSTIVFPDVSVMLEMGRRAGILAIATPTAVGQLFFDIGELVHAVFGDLSGPDAFYRMMSETAGQFEFSPGPCPIVGSARTIHMSVTGLLMEGARLLDASAAALELSSNVMVSRRTPLTTLQVASPSGPAPALPPAPRLAAEFERGIIDPASRGELHHWSREALAVWTQEEARGPRLHIHLFAELAAGTSALLGLADHGADAKLVQGLDAGSEIFGLSFQLRNEHVVDVVLIDIRSPAEISRYLCRVPSIVLLAPPAGDIVTIGARARVEIETVLTGLPPHALLAVGNPSLEATLQELRADRGGYLSVRRWPGALGDHRTDLRALLADGIRLWAPRRALYSLPPRSFVG